MNSNGSNKLGYFVELKFRFFIFDMTILGGAIVTSTVKITTALARTLTKFVKLIILWFTADTFLN